MAVPRQVHLFDRPTRFVAGTVGQPGDRTFYLQATDETGRTVSVALEKTQVQVLADRMSELLDEIAERAGTVIPPEADIDDLEPLTPPVDEEFRVAAMGLAWDGAEKAVVVEAVAATDEPIDEDTILSDSDEGPDALRVTITPMAARAFVARARRAGAARPPPPPAGSWPPAGRPARCAPCPSTPAATSAPGRTATAADRGSSAPMSEQPAGADLRAPLDDAEALELIRTGEIDLEGRLLDASNVTLGGAIRTGTLVAECVYKPVAGERPLWDFPDGTLAGREVSAYLVSEATGWRVVPPTVLREGPFGPGMVQLWMDGDPAVDLAAFVRRDDPALRRMAVFDAVVNNADRKGGHIIPMPDGHVYGVDHGICFSTDPKLRTLLWRGAGKPLPDDAVEVLERLDDDLRGDLGERLHEHLTRREVRCTQQRVAGLLRTGRHPEPSGEWPALPGPPF